MRSLQPSTFSHLNINGFPNEFCPLFEASKAMISQTFLIERLRVDWLDEAEAVTGWNFSYSETFWWLDGPRCEGRYNIEELMECKDFSVSGPLIA